MENSQLYLNKVMLNITTSKDQSLNFTKGEVLRGIVQDVKADGLVSLFIKGQVIDAVSEILVRPGQQLQLMVEDFRDGRAYLKALTPQLMERIENSNISLNLTEIGVPAKEDNIMMARKLLQYKLPVTPNNLNLMSKAMIILGGANGKNAEIVAFSMAQKLPLDPPALKSLAQFLLSANDVSKLAGSMDKGLLQLEQTIARMGETGGPSHAASSRQVGEMGPEATRQPGIWGDKLIAEKMFSATAAANKGSESLLQASSKGPELQNLTGAKSGEAPLPGEGRTIGQTASALEAKTGSVIEQSSGKIKLEGLLPGNTKNSEQPLKLADTVRDISMTSAKDLAGSTRTTNSGSLTQPSPQMEKVAGTQPAVSPGKAGGETLGGTKVLVGQMTPASDSSESLPATEIGKAQSGNRPADMGRPGSLSVLSNETLEFGKSLGTKMSESSINTKDMASSIMKNAYTSTVSEVDRPSAAAAAAADGKSANTFLPSGNIPEIAPSTGGIAGESLKQTSGQGAVAQAAPPIISNADAEVFKEAFALLTAPNNAEAAPEQRELLRHLPLLRILLEKLYLNLEGDSREISNRLQNALASEREIIRGLNLLQDIIKSDS
ncbi:MAG: hypothetical protein PHP26_11065, partial [Syntrophomonas sp.]|nr:hypothetical protein [Syntrophomonas sp.]